MDLVPIRKQALTRGEFERLADVPPEEEWLANITSEKTKRAYRCDVREFIAYAGLHDYGELRTIVRAHIIDWCRDMEQRALEPTTAGPDTDAFTPTKDQSLMSPQPC
jgi:integrase/recombinase XerD